MVELAELLVLTIPWADWAYFAKNGGDATSLAVRMARAATGRKILRCSAFEIILIISHAFLSTTPPRARAVLDVHACRMLIGACNPMPFPIPVFRAARPSGGAPWWTVCS